MKREKVPGLSLAIAHLADVFLGKKTPELLSVQGLFANTEHCLSLMSRKTSLHMEFKTQQVREAWVVGIKNAYAAAGRAVKESKPGDAPGTRITTIVSSKKVDAVKVSPVLLEGRAFVPLSGRQRLRQEEEDPPVAGQAGGLPGHPLLGGHGGCGHQAAAGQAARAGHPRQQDQRRVHRQADAAVPTWPQWRPSPWTAVCPSASKEVTLDLAAKFPRDRKEWLTAIHTVFLSSGKKVVENEPSVHKVVLDQPVWTPFGEGLAERYPRNDGLTAVQLKWAIAYVNLESIHRLVQVETPLRPGPSPAR